MELRPYQKECIAEIEKQKGGNHLIQMATGLGKTVTFANIPRKGRVLILSHREELVRQPEKYYQCSFGMEQADKHSDGEEVVSACVQSLVKRLSNFSPDDFDMIITDEAHHAVAASYRKIYDYFKPRIHLGFTATPNRGDRLRLDTVYDDILFSRELLWGIRKGYLSNVECFRVDVGYDISKVGTYMGDYKIGELEEAVNITEANEAVAKAYYEHAKGQTLIFATSVEHANKLAEKIEGAVVVHAKTKNREDIIRRFTNREFSCLINCMVFTEGTDIPLIETIMIVRPTKNVSLYTQMVGRGLRLYPGKEGLTLIDCVGVSQMHDICTAPTLLGLDVDAVPKDRLSNIKGKLTTLKRVIQTQVDNPEVWKISTQRINLFAKKNSYDLRDVNWHLCINGDLLLMLPQTQLCIKAMDELGKTRLEFTSWFPGQLYPDTEKSPSMTMDEAFAAARGFLEAHYDDRRALWDTSITKLWENAPATDKQIQILRKKLPAEELKRVSIETLTKREASNILTFLLRK